MITAFPEFKIVEVDDRKAVEVHTHRYPPHSDFNFTSLWAWDTSSERMISELNGNLVVRFTDYATNKPFLSFLGTNEAEHTARILIDFCKQNGLPETLKLISEESTQGIRESVFSVEEDRDNFDYVYSIAELSELRGSKYMSKRGRVNKFRRENPNVIVKNIDLADTETRQSILEIIDKWEENKIAHSKEYEIEHERAAIVRLCDTASAHELVSIGIFLEGQMLGFSIEELLPDKYSICHFWKADTSRMGVFDFLMQEKAKNLGILGALYINYEQDLGVPALRVAKSSFRPVFFIKKYRVSLE